MAQKVLTITVTLDERDIPGRSGRISAEGLVNLFYGIDDGQVSARYDTSVRDALPACSGHCEAPGYGE